MSHYSYTVTFQLIAVIFLVSQSLLVGAVNLPQSVTDALGKLGLTADLEDLNLDLSDQIGISTGCLIACHILSLSRKHSVSLNGTLEFALQQSRYWDTQQSAIFPACHAVVNSASDVSFILLLAEATQCPFAVKSGGHSDIPGFSNSKGGITIDLGQLKQLDVSRDLRTTQTGPGNTWGSVYEQLDARNLTVIGGRESGVGVGGLTLGGGMSFFSGQHGFACDNVQNYQVVLADGKIVDINQKSNPDLYFALRGGGNNFGIVTRFDLDTYEQGLLWGGIQVFPSTLNVSINKAFETFNANAEKDPSAALILSYSYSFKANTYFATTVYDYALPTVFPPIFEDFKKIASNNTPILDTTRFSPLANFTEELMQGTPAGFRNRYTTATFGNSALLIERTLEIYQSELEAVRPSITNTTGFNPTLAFQPISKAIISHFSTNGGNPLGISYDEGPLILVQFNWAWPSAADDQRCITAIGNILRRSVEVAKSMGLFNEYIYLNYAAADQVPYDGYGAANKARLQSISKKYDPNGVFQKLQPGGFKLFT
ncbi:MAG: hypothetical protein M1836_003063 [Candelina mexicana]|nr:MAG: hypothetical protein M1836_003063 [Candelina mexicana]